MRFYRDHPVVETLYAQGKRLRQGFERAIEGNGLVGYVDVVGRDCNLLFGTRDGDKRPSQPFRTLFMQEMVKCGVIAPSFVVSYSHSEADIDRTLEAVGEALKVYRKALDGGVDKYLAGQSVRPVFRRYAHSRQ